MSKVKTFECKCGKVFNRYMGYKTNKRQYSWWRRAYKSYCTELHRDVWCKETRVRRCEDCMWFRESDIEGEGIIFCTVEYETKNMINPNCSNYKRKWYLFWRSK